MATTPCLFTGLHDPYEVIFTIKDKKLVDMKIGEGKENMFMTDEQFAEFTKNIIDTQEHGRGCRFPARRSTARRSPAAS